MQITTQPKNYKILHNNKSLAQELHWSPCIFQKKQHLHSNIPEFRTTAVTGDHEEGGAAWCQDQFLKNCKGGSAFSYLTLFWVVATIRGKEGGGVEKALQPCRGISVHPEQLSLYALGLFLLHWFLLLPPWSWYFLIFLRSPVCETPSCRAASRILGVALRVSSKIATS